MQSHHVFFSGLSCARHILCTSVNRDFHQCLFIKPSGLLNNNWKVGLSASRHCWWARIQGIASTLCPGSKWVLSSPIVQSKSCPAAGARAVIQLLGSFSIAIKLTRLCLTSNVKISFCFCSSCFSPLNLSHRHRRSLHCSPVFSSFLLETVVVSVSPTSSRSEPGIVTVLSWLKWDCEAVSLFPSSVGFRASQ